jgi:(2Fe-2S) ferredoxin
MQTKLECHLFICTNSKPNGKDCASKGSVELLEAVKSKAKENASWHGRVRVNRAGCLGQCEKGIASVMYPKSQWRLELNKEAAATLLEDIKVELK